MNRKIESLFYIIGCGIISTMTGFGMFWHYMLFSSFPVMGCILIGMFTSSLMTALLVILLINQNHPYIAKGSPTKRSPTKRWKI